MLLSLCVFVLVGIADMSTVDIVMFISVSLAVVLGCCAFGVALVELKRDIINSMCPKCNKLLL